MKADLVTKVCGIDYSMTCPCVCVYDGVLSKFNAKDCKWYFLSSIKSLGDNMFFEGRIHSEIFKEWRNSIQRYKNISTWALDKAKGSSMVIIEDYSMGSKGKVFHIAENCGILKHDLYMAEIPYDTVPPTSLKKFASWKGKRTKGRYVSEFSFRDGNRHQELCKPQTKRVRQSDIGYCGLLLLSKILCYWISVTLISVWGRSEHRPPSPKSEKS